MVTVRSNGTAGPLLFLTNQKSISNDLVLQLPPDVMLDCTDNGFITGVSYARWIVRIIKHYNVTPENPFPPHH